MAKRTILIQNPCKLSVDSGRLLISRSEGDVTFALSEIWVLILESHLVTITVALLSSLSEAGIGVITCGSNHMPNGLHLPIGAHSRHSAIVEHQLLISAPLRKRLWQQVVRQKILNQAKCLEKQGKPANKLIAYAKSVKSGDSGGAEAAAAAEYFREILPAGTRRDGPYAAPLDYGYAILRASIARCCVAGGWLVSRGIHHDSDLNAFNLADDFIEPFRAFVDDIVLSEDIRSPLSSKDKKRIATVLEREVVVDGLTMNIQYASEAVLKSFKRAVLDNDPSLLKLPSFPETR